MAEACLEQRAPDGRLEKPYLSLNLAVCLWLMGAPGWMQPFEGCGRRVQLTRTVRVELAYSICSCKFFHRYNIVIGFPGSVGVKTDELREGVHNEETCAFVVDAHVVLTVEDQMVPGQPVTKGGARSCGCTFRIRILPVSACAGFGAIADVTERIFGEVKEQVFLGDSCCSQLYLLL